MTAPAISCAEVGGPFDVVVACKLADSRRTTAFLLSDDAAYVTGATVPVDGGVTIT